MNQSFAPVWSGLRNSSIIAAVAMLAAACAGAPHSVKTEQVSEEWGGNAYKELLIIGAYDDQTYRASAETAFAQELKSRGISAKPSFNSVPNLRELDLESEVADIVANEQVDAVLSVSTIDPGYEFGYEDAMAHRGIVYLLGGRPGAGTELGSFISWAGSGFYKLHLALWDARTQKPVWQVTTSSESTGSESEDLKALVDFTVDRLREKGLL